jgi:hypothetical protein
MKGKHRIAGVIACFTDRCRLLKNLLGPTKVAALLIDSAETNLRRANIASVGLPLASPIVAAR